MRTLGNTVFGTAEFVGDFEPGSEEWHAARANGAGGSELAAILGLSPWESRFSLWHRKAGLAAPVAENDVMYWGKVLEPAIRDEFNRRHFDGVDTLDAHQIGTWRHADRHWQIANPDGMVWRGDQYPGWDQPVSLLECKTARTDDGWGDEGTDEIPVYYRTQCLWYLDTFGLDVCHVAVLIGGSDYREYQVTYSADEAEFMRAKAVEFLATVKNGERPDIDEHDATYQVVREMHPEIDGETVEVPAAIAEPFLDANDAFNAAKDTKRQATAVLADFMGAAQRAYYRDEQIADRRSKNGGTPYVQATSRKAPGQKVSTAA